MVAASIHNGDMKSFWHDVTSMSPSALVALVALLAAVGSMFFAGVQARMAAKQTKLMQATAQLSFNLEVMTRLGDVLMAVAEDPAAHTLVWKTGGEKVGRPQVAGQNILDVICMALKAVDTLPGFSANSDDWSSYAQYVMDNSPHLREEVFENPQWWPELAPFAHTVAPSPASIPV